MDANAQVDTLLYTSGLNGVGVYSTQTVSGCEEGGAPPVAPPLGSVVLRAG